MADLFPTAGILDHARVIVDVLEVIDRHAGPRPYAITANPFRVSMQWDDLDRMRHVADLFHAPVGDPDTSSDYEQTRAVASTWSVPVELVACVPKGGES